MLITGADPEPTPPPPPPPSPPPFPPPHFPVEVALESCADASNNPTTCGAVSDTVLLVQWSADVNDYQDELAEMMDNVIDSYALEADSSGDYDANDWSPRVGIITYQWDITHFLTNGQSDYVAEGVITTTVHALSGNASSLKAAVATRKSTDVDDLFPPQDQSCSACGIAAAQAMLDAGKRPTAYGRVIMVIASRSAGLGGDPQAVDFADALRAQGYTLTVVQFQPQSVGNSFNHAMDDVDDSDGDSYGLVPSADLARYYYGSQSTPITALSDVASTKAMIVPICQQVHYVCAASSWLRCEAAADVFIHGKAAFFDGSLRCKINGNLETAVHIDDATVRCIASSWAPVGEAVTVEVSINGGTFYTYGGPSADTSYSASRTMIECTSPSAPPPSPPPPSPPPPSPPPSPPPPSPPPPSPPPSPPPPSPPPSPPPPSPPPSPPP